MRTLLAVSFLSLAFTDALACVDPPPLAEEDAKESKAILFGYVTGTRLPAYEQHLLSGKPANLRPTFDSRLARVTVTRTIKGRPTETIEAFVPCGGPAPIDGEPVVVVRRNDRDKLVRVKYWPNYLNQLSEALRNER